ncbi:MAG TPA: DJ-1/PfpI family protein [Candidatus Binatia bacterium]|nr:DJ-1/PfpI family protein [Candidatus Binatia bacterium]
MNRREAIQKAALLSFASAIPVAFANARAAHGLNDPVRDEFGSYQDRGASPLEPPAHGSIPVAFVLSEGAVIIDFCGPWEVFERVNVSGHPEGAFRLYTVAKTADAIHAGGGMKIVPDYTFDNAPGPKVIVIPAQDGSSPAMLEWIRKSTKNTDVTMSVCTGAFVLAQTGLLSGKSATTHHAAYKTFAIEFPDVRLKRGARFTEDGNLATAGGLSSGIDLALRVVQRYFGYQVAVDTASMLEYQGQGWLNADSNEIYAKARISTDEHPLCPVCDMEVDPKTSPTSAYKGKTYYFCTNQHKTTFDADPQKYLAPAW